MSPAPRARRKRKSVLDGLQSVSNGWKETFREGQKGLYSCPSCSIGKLSPDEATFHKKETPESLRNAHDEDDPYVTVYREYLFTGLLVCSEKFCAQAVTVSGRLEVASEMREADDDYGQAQEIVVESSTYHPGAMIPAPRLFIAPPNCPESISRELDRAFKLYWVDDRACANSIRSAVELLMNHQKIPATLVDKKGNRRLRSLHTRIETWGKRPNRDKLAKALMAIKFIGNEGSHRGKDNGVIRRDIYHGFTFFKHVLDTVFIMEHHARALDLMATKIVKRRKPLSQLETG